MIPEPNVYLDSRRHWNSALEKAHQSSKNWQIVAMASLCIGIGGVGGMTYLGSKPRFVPFIVQVDKLGEALAVKPAEGLSEHDPRVVRAMVAQFVADVRNVSADRDLDHDAIYRAFYLLKEKDAAAAKLAQYWDVDKKKDKYNRAETETVNVELSSVVPVSPNSWQADWTETVRDREGGIKETFSMRGVFTVGFEPWVEGASFQQITTNPIGLYVRDYEMNRL